MVPSGMRVFVANHFLIPLSSPPISSVPTLSAYIPTHIHTRIRTLVPQLRRAVS